MRSKSEVRRLIKQGAIEINGKKITTKDALKPLQDGDVIKIGKKEFFKVKIV